MLVLLYEVLWTVLNLLPVVVPVLLLTLPLAQFLLSCSGRITPCWPPSSLSEASPTLFGWDLLAKFRPWPIGLTWQEKQKPGDELCAQTHCQMFRYTCALTCSHGISCLRVHKYDDPQWNAHSVELPSTGALTSCIPSVIQSTLLHRRESNDPPQIIRSPGVKWAHILNC